MGCASAPLWFGGKKRADFQGFSLSLGTYDKFDSFVVYDIMPG